MTGEEKIQMMKALGCPAVTEIVGRNEMVLCEEISRLETMLRESNQIIHDQVVGMQAALIEAAHNGSASGLTWIYNALCGPGNLPDENDEWFDDANDYYNAHCSNPLGPCEICGRPSGAAGGGHVACNLEHLKMSKRSNMHTIEEAKAWVEQNKAELIQSLLDNSEIPDYAKKLGHRFEAVWCSGCWMNHQLREAGATEDEVYRIGFTHGQRSVFADPYRWAVAYLNEYKSQGAVADEPGRKLADEINNTHMQVNGDVVGLAIESPS